MKKRTRIIFGVLLAVVICMASVAHMVAQPSPFMIDGYVYDAASSPCNGPDVQITNLNTSESWSATTVSTSNHYQLVLSSEDVSAGNMLRIAVSGCSQSKTVEHAVTQNEIDAGGFMMNITLGVPMASNVETSATVNNLAPDVAITTISPDPATPSCTVTVSGTLSDPNGIDDVSTLTYVVKKPDSTTYTSGSATVAASWSFDFDLGSDADAGIWTVEVTATDAGSLSDTDSKTFNVSEVIAFSIDFNETNYGSIAPGNASTVPGNSTMETVGPAPPVKPTIRNDGNTVMDVQMSITDEASNPEPLFEGNTAATVGSVGPQTLTSTATTFDVNIAKGDTAKIDTTLSVPTGTSPGDYAGTLTITAVSS